MAETITALCQDCGLSVRRLGIERDDYVACWQCTFGIEDYSEVRVACYRERICIKSAYGRGQRAHRRDWKP